MYDRNIEQGRFEHSKVFGAGVHCQSQELASGRTAEAVYTRSKEDKAKDAIETMIAVMNNLRKDDGIDVDDRMMRNSNVYPFPICRFIVFDYLVKGGMGYSETGRLLGRNHATVMYGIRQMHNLLDSKNKMITEIYNKFYERIRSNSHEGRDKSDR